MTRPSTVLFQKQLEWLNYWSTLRAERITEILGETDDILAPMAAVVDLNPARRPYTFELIGAFYQTVASVEMRFKNAMACRRPVEYSAQIQPMIQTPGHSSYPSGHATESFAFAYLLATLANYRPHAGSGTALSAMTAAQLAEHAYRTTQNRVVAGVHFPVDNDAGSQLGLTMARYLVDRFMTAAGGVPPGPAGGSVLSISFGDNDNNDFDYLPYWNAAPIPGPPPAPPSPTPVPTGPGPDAILGALWNRAVAEWV